MCSRPIALARSNSAVSSCTSPCCDSGGRLLFWRSACSVAPQSNADRRCKCLAGVGAFDLRLQSHVTHRDRQQLVIRVSVVCVGSHYLFGTTQPGPGYVAVKPDRVTVPPFEYSGCTQNPPLVI